MALRLLVLEAAAEEPTRIHRAVFRVPGGSRLIISPIGRLVVQPNIRSKSHRINTRDLSSQRANPDELRGRAASGFIAGGATRALGIGGLPTF